jgi:hypothetical protein
MSDAQPPDRCAAAPDDRTPQAAGSACEAAEVAALLMQAGIDHASALWFQMLELATQLACDWVERSAETFAPLDSRAAAVLGLRSLAADLLCTAPDQDEAAHAAAEACLGVCADADRPSAPPPTRRRWGEGALPPPPPRSRLLSHDAGSC